MITYKIHLIRTGSTSDGQRRNYVGQQDLPLSSGGEEKLLTLKKDYRYPGIEKIYTSPLTRCIKTAEILYPELKPETVEELKDMNLGAFEGKTFEELKDNDDFIAWLDNSFANTPPGGEEVTAFNERILAGLDTVFKEMMEKGITSAGVVTHGGVIMSLMARVGIPKQPLHLWSADNGAGYTLSMTPQLWMRDHSAEVFSLVPMPLLEDEMDMYGFYYNE